MLSVLIRIAPLKKLRGHIDLGLCIRACIRLSDTLFMPPTSQKLTGHIGVGFSVHASVYPSEHLSVRQEPCMLVF